jgi:transcriptional regulator with PAS, ATPase and Fis domain
MNESVVNIAKPTIEEEQVEALDNGLFFLAASPVMRTLRSQLQLIARVDVPVLMLGESGVGKEVIARLIHKLSRRADAPLLKVNCAALPADLLESELFGYEKGAFTGAIQSKPGKFELCHKGTILLDEIGEMHCSLQAKLLHVLQDGQFSRLGGRSNIAKDFRVLAATNIDIQKAVRNGSFREDLYYRLNAFTVRVPPLRERREEIRPLIRHFMKRYSEQLGCSPMDYSQELIEICLQYPWPGNLRELENFVKRHLILRDERLAIAELRKTMPVIHVSVNGPASPEDLKSVLRDVNAQTEVKAIREALRATDWNRRLAAEWLNISYKALLYKMKHYGNALQLTAEIATTAEVNDQSEERRSSGNRNVALNPKHTWDSFQATVPHKEVDIAR